MALRLKPSGNCQGHNLEAEYARSNFDQRHLLTASLEYTSGSGTAGGTLLDGWKGRLWKDWTFTANLSTGSGLPLTPVYFAPVGGASTVEYPGPPLPSPFGSPPWMTKFGTILWKIRPS